MRDLTFTERNEIDAKLCECKKCKSIPTIIQRGDLFNASDTAEYQVVCRECESGTKFYNNLESAIESWNKNHSNGESTAHIPRVKEFNIVLSLTKRQCEKMEKICTTPVEKALEEDLYKKGKKYTFNAEMGWNQPFARLIVDTGNLSKFDRLPRVVLKIFPKWNVGLRNPDMDGIIVSNSLMDNVDESKWLSEIFNNETELHTWRKGYPRKCSENKFPSDGYVIDEMVYHFSVRKY